MARLGYATREDFPEELKYVWDKNLTGGRMSNIFRVMGNNPALVRGYTRLGSALWAECGLDVETRELAILRVAILVHSQYEWHQHVRIARGATVADERINALQDWRASELFSLAERAMLGYIDAIVASDHPSQEVHDNLAAHFPPGTVVGINLLGAYYVMTAKFLSGMEVEPEGAFVGWEL